MAGCRLRPALTSKDLTVPNNPADVVMTSEIAEGQRTRLRVEKQKEMQTNATCEQTAAKSPDAEPRVEMRCAQAVAHGSNNFAEFVAIAVSERLRHRHRRGSFRWWGRSRASHRGHDHHRKRGGRDRRAVAHATRRLSAPSKAGRGHVCAIPAL